MHNNAINQKSQTPKWVIQQTQYGLFWPKRYGKERKIAKDKAFHKLCSPDNLNYFWKTKSVLDFGKQSSRNQTATNKPIKLKEEFWVTWYDTKPQLVLEVLNKSYI